MQGFEMNIAALTRRLRIALAVSVSLAIGGPAGFAPVAPALGPQGSAQQPSVDRGYPRYVTPATRVAIDRGLAYLAGVQNRDGSWMNRRGFEAFPVAMTALAGIAFLMDGNTTTEGRYAQEVDRAVTYILNSVQPDGLIGRPDEESRPMYGHGFSMLFLGELNGMVEGPVRQRQIQTVLRNAALLAGRAQSRLGGWYYTSDSFRDEGSVTITQVQGLRSLRNGGVAVSKQIIDDAMRYLDLSQNPDGGIAYTASRPGPSRPPLTGAAAACWLNAGDYDNPRLFRAMDYARQTIRPDGTNPNHFFYAHLYMAQAVYVSGDRYWDDYFPRLRDQFLSLQSTTDGSWIGDSIGDVYGTAVALIILQLPYNQLPIMQR